MFATPILQHQHPVSATEFRLITFQGTKQDTDVSGLRTVTCPITHPVAAYIVQPAHPTAVKCQSAAVRRCLLIDKTLKDLASSRKTSGGGHFTALAYTREREGAPTRGRWVRRARVWAVMVKMTRARWRRSVLIVGGGDEHTASADWSTHLSCARCAIRSIVVQRQPARHRPL